MVVQGLVYPPCLLAYIFFKSQIDCKSVRLISLGHQVVKEKKCENLILFLPGSPPYFCKSKSILVARQGKQKLCIYSPQPCRHAVYSTQRMISLTGSKERSLFSDEIRCHAFKTLHIITQQSTCQNNMRLWSTVVTSFFIFLTPQDLQFR